ncbi:MAG: CHAP domain-containing protein, partial [Oscillospiraceae bacterium]
MSAADKVIEIAENEVGYLEKASNSNLYDKTANAGSNNYTKYWAEIKPEYQGQPWCACFVTWCFVQAFGKDKATQLLKHYPYVYCPTMSGLFKLYANPQRGDIVIFKNNGTFTHTGIVTSVNGDYFTTVEGNTSGGSAIIANGGGVCSKGYYNSNLPGTKFCRPEYSLVEEDELMSKEYEEL